MKSILRKHIKKIKLATRYSPYRMFLFACLFAVIGVVSLLIVRAATLTASIQPEQGNRSGTASVVSGDSSASNSAYVQFNAPSASGGGMQFVSRSVPVFAATNTGSIGLIQDTDLSGGWETSSLPSWAAFDLSSLTAAQKAKLLVAIYAPRAGDYYKENGIEAWQMAPTNYVVEVNSAAGGGTAPTNGWTAAVTVPSTKYTQMQHIITLTGNNWVRVRVLAGGGSSSVTLNVDIYSFGGAVPSDDWLMMGDSITAMTFATYASDLTQRVAALSPGRWPAIVPAGLGGTSTTTALDVIDGYLANFPGKYVALNYGTNNHPTEFKPEMETLVQKVIAAGRVPVIPHIPWTDTKGTEVEQMNTMIDQLYAKYPAILHGPDIYALTLNRTDYIASGDVHPGNTGQAAIRGAWATLMNAQTP